MTVLSICSISNRTCGCKLLPCRRSRRAGRRQCWPASGQSEKQWPGHGRAAAGGSAGPAGSLASSGPRLPSRWPWRRARRRVIQLRVPRAAASRHCHPPGMSCAWPIAAKREDGQHRASLTRQRQYWLQPIVASAGTRIVVSGRFPDARYASFSVYKPNGNPVTGNGVSSSLPDYRIAPAARQPESLAAAGRARRPVHGDHPPGSRTGPGQHAADARRYHQPAPRVTSYTVSTSRARATSRTCRFRSLTVEQGGAARTLPACPRHSGQHRAAVPAPATGSAAARRPARGAGTVGPQSVPPPAGVLQGLPRQVGSECFTNTDTAYV